MTLFIVVYVELNFKLLYEFYYLWLFLLDGRDLFRVIFVLNFIVFFWICNNVRGERVEELMLFGGGVVEIVSGIIWLIIIKYNIDYFFFKV